jgi:hypothetical protein
MVFLDRLGPLRFAGLAPSGSPMSPNCRWPTPSTGHRSTGPATAHFAAADPEGGWRPMPARRAQGPSSRETSRDGLRPHGQCTGRRRHEPGNPEAHCCRRHHPVQQRHHDRRLGGDGLVQARRPLPGRLRSAHLPAQLDTNPQFNGQCFSVDWSCGSKNKSFWKARRWPICPPSWLVQSRVASRRGSRPCGSR